MSMANKIALSAQCVQSIIAMYETIMYAAAVVAAAASATVVAMGREQTPFHLYDEHLMSAVRYTLYKVPVFML